MEAAHDRLHRPPSPELLPVVLIASMAIFGMIHAIPGGPVAGIVGENATPEQIVEVTRRLGLDRPFVVQYADWLGRAVAGDLGQSLHSREPVTRAHRRAAPGYFAAGAGGDDLRPAVRHPRRGGECAAPGSLLDRTLSDGALSLSPSRHSGSAYSSFCCSRSRCAGCHRPRAMCPSGRTPPKCCATRCCPP